MLSFAQSERAHAVAAILSAAAALLAIVQLVIAVRTGHIADWQIYVTGIVYILISAMLWLHRSARKAGQARGR